MRLCLGQGAQQELERRAGRVSSRLVLGSYKPRREKLQVTSNIPEKLNKTTFCLQKLAKLTQFGARNRAIRYGIADSHSSHQICGPHKFNLIEIWKKRIIKSY